MTMSAKLLFKNVKLLEEKPSDKDLIGVENEISRVSKFIDNLIMQRKHSIVAYLGAFGTGKSSILKEIEARRPQIKWINFELWRYANRHEIWEGFVTRVISDLEQKPESTITDRLDSPDWSLKIRIIAFSLSVLVGLPLLMFVSFEVWDHLHGSTNRDLFVKAFLKYASPIMVTLVVLLGLGNLLQWKPLAQRRPIRRVFELEDMLHRSLRRKLKTPLVIVVEDVDRTTEDGVIFLETLHTFLDSHLIPQPLVIIAPQAQLAFDNINNSGLNGFERSLKIYDEKIFLSTTLGDDTVTSFYDALGINAQYRHNLIQATDILLQNYRSTLSVRMLKNILREVMNFMNSYNEADPTIAFVAILARYLPVRTSGSNETFSAQKILVGQSPYDSESISVLFRAFAIAGGAFDDAMSISRFRLFFESIDGEIKYVRNKASPEIADITIDTKYEALFSGN